MTLQDHLAAALLDYFRSPEYVASAKKFAGEWLQALPREREHEALAFKERLARHLAEHLAKIPGLRIEEPNSWHKTLAEEGPIILDD